MSTIKAANIQHPSAASPVFKLSADGGFTNIYGSAASGSVSSVSSSSATLVTVNATNGTTTSTTNFRMEFTSTYMGIWNQANDVIPAATVTAMKAVPSGALITITDGTTTYTGTFTSGYAYDASNNLDWNVTGGTAPNGTWDEATHPGMSIKAEVTTQIVTTDITNLPTLLALNGAVLVINGRQMSPSLYTVAGAVVTTIDTGLTVSAGNTVTIALPLELIATGEMYSGDTTTFQFSGDGGYTFRHADGYVRFGDDNGVAAGGNARAVPMIDVGNVSSYGWPQIRITSESANSMSPDLVFRRSGNPPGSPLTAPPPTETVGNILWEQHDGTGAWQEMAKLHVYVNSDTNGLLPHVCVDIDNGTVFSVDKYGMLDGQNGALGSWNIWTPTIGGTGWAFGDAVILGRECVIGSLRAFTIKITWGATSTFGTGQLTLSHPNAWNYGNAGMHYTCRGTAYDSSGAAKYPIVAETAAGAGPFSVYNSVSPYTNVTSTAPFTWASGDWLLLTGIGYD